MTKSPAIPFHPIQGNEPTLCPEIHVVHILQQNILRVSDPIHIICIALCFLSLFYFIMSYCFESLTVLSV